MKIKNNEIILLGSLLVILATPYLPTAIINAAVGNRIGAFLVICLAVYTFKLNIILGLGVFLATAALFLEYRRRTIDTIRTAFSQKQVGAPVKELTKSAKPLIPGEVHPGSEDPSIEESGYEPSHSEDQDIHLQEATDAYESRAVENDKMPLETVPSNNSGEVGQFFLNKGLANVMNSSNSA